MLLRFLGSRLAPSAMRAAVPSPGPLESESEGSGGRDDDEASIGEEGSAGEDGPACCGAGRTGLDPFSLPLRSTSAWICLLPIGGV